ncbi:MAG: HNH endonuclease [Lachnospiraceae bacterium]|nr:HNH endonuclease [Lachnospiraceae bacterium]
MNNELVELKKFPNYYINKYGEVYSNRSGQLKKMKTYIGSNGKYEYLTISVKGYRNKLTIHRLVAETFIPNQNNYSDVDHIDYNTLNNNVDNLRWVTRSYNIKRSIDEGRKNYDFCKKKVQIYKNNKLICESNGLNETCKKISKQYNVSYNSLIRFKKHKDFVVKFVE